MSWAHTGNGWMVPTPRSSRELSGVQIIPAARYSILGTPTPINVNTTTPAGTTLPATGGEIIINPAQLGRVVISGTAAKVGDCVRYSFEGVRFDNPASPAQRRVSGAGPGAAGANALVAGEIELAISSVSDGNRIFWWLGGRS